MPKITSSHFPDTLELRDFFSNEAANVYLYDNFAVVEVTEGTTLSFKNGFTLLLKGLSIIGSKPWIYVSNRINSYSVKPTDYKYLNKVPTLKGLAIVSTSTSEINNAHLEKAFFTKPFNIVNSLDEAYDWGKGILAKN
tara:strand:- start:84534 stop:84947 length:414 start_codon:yes stop_codon:yes gene_type:complete